MPKELKAHRLTREIKELKSELSKHQARCKHEKVIKKSGGSCGEWDTDEDQYWTDFDCPTCLKIWREHKKNTHYRLVIV